MLSAGCVRELETAWFPNLTDSGLDRLIELLETSSPLLIHGAFSRSMPMGCLATHAAWHHPKTCDLAEEPGIMWLTRVAGLNPATSQVVQAWDEHGEGRWRICRALLDELQAERSRRQLKLDSSRSLVSQLS